MVKNVVIVVLLVAVAGLGYTLYAPEAVAPTADSTVPTQNEDMQVCAQVITPARNPETGEIREFPTPCDVPDNWEVIENDVPTLDLQVQ